MYEQSFSYLIHHLNLSTLVFIAACHGTKVNCVWGSTSDPVTHPWAWKRCDCRFTMRFYDAHGRVCALGKVAETVYKEQLGSTAICFVLDQETGTRLRLVLANSVAR